MEQKLDLDTYAASIGLSPDDPVLPFLEANAKFAQQTEAWIETVSGLVKTLGDLQGATQAIGKDSKEIAESLADLKERLDNLTREIEKLNRFIERNDPDFQLRLFRSIITLKDDLATISKLFKESTQQSKDFVQRIAREKRKKLLQIDTWIVICAVFLMGLVNLWVDYRR